MDPIDWPAVIAAPFLAVIVGLVWYGPVFGPASGAGAPRPGKAGGIIGALVLNALPALMLGHAFARIGAEKLAARPWLYWMQSGGIAMAFIVPALWIAYARLGVPRRDALVDAGYWIVTFLAIGTLFWVLG